MRWNNEENFLVDSISLRVVSHGISLRLKPVSSPSDRRRVTHPQSADLAQTSGAEKTDRSKTRVRHSQFNITREKRRRVLAAGDPRINQICPFLQHVAALGFVFGLVINAA